MTGKPWGYASSTQLLVFLSLSLSVFFVCCCSFTKWKKKLYTFCKFVNSINFPSAHVVHSPPNWASALNINLSERSVYISREVVVCMYMFVINLKCTFFLNWQKRYIYKSLEKERENRYKTNSNNEKKFRRMGSIIFKVDAVKQASYAPH